MNDKHLGPLPQEGKDDIAYGLTRVVLSAIPVAGGPLVEYIGMVLGPPVSRRRDQWLTSLAEGVTALQHKIDGYSIEALSENAAFITAVMHATQIAIRNHNREKLDALRSGVLNTALPITLDEDMQLRFLALIDELTPAQIRILQCLDNPDDCQRKYGFDYFTDIRSEVIRSPDFTIAGLDSPVPLLGVAFPELGNNPELLLYLSNDLQRRQLIEGLSIREGRVQPATTTLAKQFVAFITSPLTE